MDALDLIRSVFALGFVIALIYALAYAARRFRLFQSALPEAFAEARLRIIESRNLDPTRKLVLVGCDGREHLILLGPGTQTVLTSTDEDDPPPPSKPDAVAPAILVEPLPADGLGRWRTGKPLSARSKQTEAA